MEKPSIKPKNPNFSSGPCSKRPGWSIDVLKNAPTGRSHRAKECKDKLNEVIIKSKQVLKLPDSYVLGIMTGSNTGALEAAMWSLLGCRGVDVLAWENFGKDWVIDVLEQLKIKNVNSHVTDYGILPDLTIACLSLSLHSFDLCDLPIGVFFKTLSSQPGRLAQGPLEKFGFNGLFDGLTKVIIIQYQLLQVIHK